MMMDAGQKEDIKRKTADCFRKEKEVRKVVLFGSFLTKSDPHDMDLAVFQDSGNDYLSLAIKYRRLIRPVASRIPVDVIPVKADAEEGSFLAEIKKGEIIYENIL
ncbi:MAG: nucleotidyltransferase domain-containing protein [Verrucomicrobiota bacterium]